MRLLTLLLVLLPCLLNRAFSSQGYTFGGYMQFHINLSPSMLPEQQSLKRLLPVVDEDTSIVHKLQSIFSVRQSKKHSLAPSSLPTQDAPYTFSNMDSAVALPETSAQPPAASAPAPAPNQVGSIPTWTKKLSRGPSPAPAFPPIYKGHASSPRRARSRHHHKRHHAVPSPSISPAHAEVPSAGCEQMTCSDPLTTTPIGSPCGCVQPMQVELDLGVAPFEVFPLIQELEIEVAAGTYLKQSQVKIMGANADSRDQGKTIVDIYLVPLGEKFDNTTALLIYERFWQNKIPLNMTLFGVYKVIYVRYPELPSPPVFAGPMSPPPEGLHPFMADVKSKSEKMNARTVAIIVLSSFVVILLFVGAIFVLFKCKSIGRVSTAVGPAVASSITKRSGMHSNLSNSEPSLTSVSLGSTVATCMLSVKTFSLHELEMATDKFSNRKFLGEGGFGRVYHGTMEDGSDVAVKLLVREHQNGEREFIAEVEMLSRLHHRNLVKLIGICIEDRVRCLVYELVPNGSVESHLHGVDKIRGPLDWDARMKIALGAARGLAYLHEDSNPRVIHRDFKAANILLEDDFTPKVSDFGLAREATEGSQHISTRVMGTFGYVAPEYAMTGHLLVKSDVYSYGVVLLELLSGRKPVDMSQPQGQENLVNWARPLLTSREGLDQLVDPYLDGNYNFDNMARVAAIASMCVHPEVSQRPFMGEVVQALKLVYSDAEDTCRDSCSQKEESSAHDYDSKGEPVHDGNWWSSGTPRLTYGYASSFITMDYSSGPLEETDRPLSTPTLLGRGGPLTRHNRSGPLRTIRHKPAFFRPRGSMSEHDFLFRRIGPNWV